MAYRHYVGPNDSGSAQICIDLVRRLIVYPDFCILCGTSFPPRAGEGACINWPGCRERTIELRKKEEETQGQLFGDPNIIDVSPPL